MPQKLIVRSAPHIHDNETTNIIMLKVIIALLPALAAAVYLFGWRALVLALACVIACVAFEHFSCLLLKRKSPIGDLSAVVTGLLLALNLPVTLPLWMAIIGCFVAIVVVKQLFGGIGQNFANPALTARVVLLISFAQPMTQWVLPRQGGAIDALTGATPLGLLAEGAALPDYATLFTGLHGGSMGETSAILLLLGGVYLIVSGIISPIVPCVYLGGVAVLALLMGQDPLFHLLSGGLLLGAIFMATDYSTRPITRKGKVIFGLGCALFTMLIRVYGSYPEGVSFSILLMNILTPLIDRYCMPKPFGAARAARKRKAVQG